LRQKVLVTDTGLIDAVVNDQQLVRLKSIADVVRKIPKSDEEMAEWIRDTDAIISGDSPLNDQILEKAEKLKIISRVGIGYDNIDLKTATKKRIIVTNLPGTLSDSVAEHAILLMLAVARRLVTADACVRGSKWSQFYEHPPDIEVSGKTLGLVGLGAIGGAVAQRAKAFNMKVLVYDPYVDEKRISTIGCRRVQLEELLRESDVISVHTPLTTETKKLIAEREFDLMKKSAILINTARGAIVDEKSLIEALKNGKIAGAGADVLTIEPPNPDNPLLSMSNVIFTPHSAAFTLDALKRLWVASSDAVLRVLAGELPQPPANIVNREVIPLLK
jgi:D-3-phosphoglycerate dehydrogenase